MDIKEYKSFWDHYDQDLIQPRNTLVESLLEWVDRHRSGAVLELGSGFGRTRVPGRVGVDICLRFLQQDQGMRVLGNACRLPFKSKAFGIAYCAWVLMHIHPDDIPCVAEEIKRVSAGLVHIDLGEPMDSTFCFLHDYDSLFGEPHSRQYSSGLREPRKHQLLEYHRWG